VNTGVYSNNERLVRWDRPSSLIGGLGTDFLLGSANEIRFSLVRQYLGSQSQLWGCVT